MNTFSMKNILKTLTIISVFMSSYSLANINSKPDLYVASGFPYKNLVERYEVVKIHYQDVDEDGVISCRVELVSNNQTSETENRQVKAKHFAAKPLKSCIDRSVAITALKQVFAD